MDIKQYQQFLNDPRTLLNGAGNVSQIRLDGSMARASNAVSRVVSQAGVSRLQYKYSNSRVTPITVRYDDTGIPQTSGIWFSQNSPAQGDYRKDRAYYLEWGVDQAYAIELGCDAQLFITAELTGCGIIVFSTPSKLIVVHHNIQVIPLPQTWLQWIIESQRAKQKREAEFVANSREQALVNLVQDIVATTPGITRGVSLSVNQYGSRARVFGVKRNNQWRLFINRPNGGIHYQTDLLYTG
ncbi:MAG: hypothetical protein ACI4NJ_04410 [Cellvibrio sp.]